MNRTYNNEDDLPRLDMNSMRQGNPVRDFRDFMVLSYFAFASMLIAQGKVGERIEGDAIVTYQELGESLYFLNHASTEPAVLTHVFADDGIWRILYIDPDTGAFSATQDGNNVPFIQVPIAETNYANQDVNAVKAIMLDTSRIAPNFGNLAAVDGVSFVCSAQNSTINYITMLWGYAHGSLGVLKDQRCSVWEHMDDAFDQLLILLRGGARSYNDKNLVNLPRYFNIVGINTRPRFLEIGAEILEIELSTEVATEVFINSKILKQQEAITSDRTTTEALLLIVLLLKLLLLIILLLILLLVKMLRMMFTKNFLIPKFII
jgi:hypothetical protein